MPRYIPQGGRPTSRGGGPRAGAVRNEATKGWGGEARAFLANVAELEGPGAAAEGSAQPSAA